MIDHSPVSEISRLSDLLSNNPDSRLFVPLAQAYLQADARSDAVSVLSEGLKKHENFVAARVMLGKIYLKKSDFQEAKEQFLLVLDIAPSNIPSLKGVAAVYRAEGLLTDALGQYKTILKVDPSDKEALESISEVKLALAAQTEINEEKVKQQEREAELTSREVDLASKALESSLETSAHETPFLESDALPSEIEADDEGEDATAAVATLTLASLYLQQEHYEEAIDIYEKLLEENPSDEKSQSGLKKALLMLQGTKKVSIVPGLSLTTTEKIDRLQSWLDVIQGDRSR